MRRLLRMQETKTKTMGSKNFRRKQAKTKRLFITLTLEDKWYRNIEKKYKRNLQMQKRSQNKPTNILSEQNIYRRRTGTIMDTKTKQGIS